MVRAWVLNDLPRWTIIGLWAVINAFLFTDTFCSFTYGDRYQYLFYLTGYGLPLAKASAKCINFNCLLLVLPVCRNIVSSVRNTVGPNCFRTFGRILDHNITYHKYIGYTVVFFSAVHVYGHCYNYFGLVEAWKPDDPIAYSLSHLSAFNLNESCINPIRHPNADPLVEVLKTLPGISGVVLVIALVVIVTSSTEFVRRSYYELFWYTHHLFVVFFIAFLVHGLHGVVRYQDNTKENDPGVCIDKISEWSPNPDKGECQNALFVPTPPSSWKWVVAPLILYFFERLMRFLRSLKPFKVAKIVFHPSQVIEIILHKNEGFLTSSGQYCFIQCRVISSYEWHPFTLTSSSQDNFLSFHIRVEGDWTNKLYQLMKSDQRPVLYLDGPFSTASEDIFRYNVAICVATGIGVTPFASLLKTIRHRTTSKAEFIKLKTVYFIWVCRDMKALEWFDDLLRSLEKEIRRQSLGALQLVYKIHMTRGWDDEKALDIFDNCDSELDDITGLAHKTQYGRPDFDKYFKKIGKDHKGKHIGVFCCGIPAVTKNIRGICKVRSDPKTDTIFYFNKENF